MKNHRIAFILLVVLTAFMACKSNSKATGNNISYQLSEAVRAEVLQEIDQMGKLDQQYRTPLSVGTLDQAVLAKDQEMRNNASISEYIAFTKTIKKTLSEHQIDSLWKLQKQLDYDNHLKVKSIVKKYGYPSPERLNQKKDVIFPILLHPPTNTNAEARAYLKEMESLLKPEVLAGRMKASTYAGFVDNIKTKILQEPQLYGTVKYFNPASMKEGLPKIKNIDKTNAARQAIGLPPLSPSEFSN